jgi:hypothetical protein
VKRQVVTSSVEQPWIVTEETESLVAWLAEQFSDLTGLMVVNKMLRLWVPADGAQVALLLS